MTELGLAVVAATCLGMALGRFPGLKLGRSGIALVALAVLFAAGALDIERPGRAVEGATLLLLLALMILSAQFGAAGFYARCTELIARSRASSARLPALTIAADARQPRLARLVLRPYTLSMLGTGVLSGGRRGAGFSSKSTALPAT
jgi:Na+/H+ antiporter NhaD/arsenite permease-like protein